MKNGEKENISHYNTHTHTQLFHGSFAKIIFSWIDNNNNNNNDYHCFIHIYG